jgi:hypothetical protein
MTFSNARTWKSFMSEPESPIKVLMRASSSWPDLVWSYSPKIIWSNSSTTTTHSSYGNPFEFLKRAEKTLKEAKAIPSNRFGLAFRSSNKHIAIPVSSKVWLAFLKSLNVSSSETLMMKTVYPMLA